MLGVLSAMEPAAMVTEEVMVAMLLGVITKPTVRGFTRAPQ